MKKVQFICFFILATLISCDFGLYGVNSETSQIGTMSPRCLDSLAWEKMCNEFSIDSIKDEKLLKRLEDVKSHFIEPRYILYFKDEPEEIVGCDWYSIRVAYNENIVDQTVTGLSSFLSNAEQKRIRNRVLKELSKYQCEKGRIETLERMNRPVPFAESHKDYGKN